MPCKKTTSVNYKDVIVIGNGPSAIALSYMLAGNTPIYSGTSNDEFLHLRLSDMPGYPITLQDLKELSEGLEGRSSNTVSLLFDALLHPDADLGSNSPSLLDWEHMPELQVDHIVLGKGQPGGAWKQFGNKDKDKDDGKVTSLAMDNNLLTVSLGAWMELPNLTLSEWKDVEANYGKRITVSLVAEYYQDYIRKMALEKYFSNDTVVTSVRKVKDCSRLCHTESRNLSYQEKLERLRSHFEPSSPEGSLKINTQSYDTKTDDVLGQESIFMQELEGDEQRYQYPSKGSTNSTSDSSTLSECSQNTPPASDPISPPQSLVLSEKTMSNFSKSYSTSGYGVSVTSSGLSSPVRTVPPKLDRRSMSMNEETTQYAPNTKDALSATRMGVYMRQQSRKRANTTCCLEFAEIDQQSCCYTAESLQASWDPIFYPSQFAASWNASSSGALISGHIANERSNSLHYFPDEKLEGENCREECHEMPCEVSKCFPEEQYLWEVSGYRYKQEGSKGEKEEFCYLTSNVVMACGQDRANSLDIPGENLPFVLHSLKELEAKIANGDLSSNSDPVIIVGAGLSAADAIIAANEHNLNVVHIFRREAQDRNLIFKSLPPKMYPEYHQVHSMMTGGRRHGARYQALEKQHLIEIFPDNTVKFHGDATKETLKVSYVLALVGARPNLDFLDVDASDDLQISSNDIGIIKENPISKNNPVDINIYTFESVLHSGLYAMGPLVGDNFVRFLQGGALAITSHILKKQRNQEKKKDIHPVVIR